MRRSQSLYNEPRTTDHEHRLLVQSFLSHFLVKYSGNDFDTSGLKGFGQQPVPTCPANGGTGEQCEKEAAKRYEGPIQRFKIISQNQ